MKIDSIVNRLFVWRLCFPLTALCAYLVWSEPLSEIPHILLFIFASGAVLGVYDRLQTKHAILKNYPVIGHFRFWFETIRPEIRQYFIETDTEEIPFSRNQRALVYQRSKGQSDQRPFGTLDNVYKPAYEWFIYSNKPTKKAVAENLRSKVGGKSCQQPYDISIFNISAMSFGALSANAIMALNRGAKLGNFAHDTGEGSISPYHRKFGGDLIWEIGSGYFGCRTQDGHFDLDSFSKQANDPQVKMIEIKLSQGAKPGHGGILPAAKVTSEIALTRNVPMGQDCISPSHHSAFNTPEELMQFIASLRSASNGKPIGFKLCIAKPKDWFAMVKAMLTTQITPDFIVVDGSEGGTGAAPVEFIDHVGMPMRDGLSLVHATLIGAHLREQIRIGAAGKIISAFDIVRTCAMGADWCNSARGFMFAIGCLQSRTCNTDRCPTGVATQNQERQMALNPFDKGDRVHHFQANTLNAVSELLSAAGLSHTSEVTPDLIMRRNTNGIAESLDAFLFSLEPGALLRPNPEKELSHHSKHFANEWLAADPQNW